MWVWDFHAPVAPYEGVLRGAWGGSIHQADRYFARYGVPGVAIRHLGHYHILSMMADEWTDNRVPWEAAVPWVSWALRRMIEHPVDAQQDEYLQAHGDTEDELFGGDFIPLPEELDHVAV